MFSPILNRPLKLDFSKPITDEKSNYDLLLECDLCWSRIKVRKLDDAAQSRKNRRQFAGAFL